MKLKLSHDEHKTATAIKIAEREIPKIEEVRKLASELIECKIESLTGEPEVLEYLTLKDYPRATRTASANLLGKASEYTAFTEGLSRLKGLKRFDVSSGNVIVSDSYKAIIQEENTEYVEGESVVIYKQLRKVASEMQKANNLMNGQLAHQMIFVRNNGECGVNDAPFKRMVIHKSKY